MGLARRGRPSVEVTPKTWFDLASLTKPLVTTTLTLLAFRGRALKLSTRVEEVLRDIRGSAVGYVDVNTSLTHTAGFPLWGPL